MPQYPEKGLRGTRKELRFRKIDVNEEPIPYELYLKEVDGEERLNFIMEDSDNPGSFIDYQIAPPISGDQGIQGAQGPQGDIGAQGFQGDIGPQGFQGAQGQTGDQGAIGAQGNQGAQGDIGAQGAKGDQGFQGEQGPQGNQGEQGPVGQTGAQGAKGDQGDQGAKGDQGFQGAKGETGDQGAQGAQGAQGQEGEIGVPGVQGEQGPQGHQGFQGDQGPQGEDGIEGVQGPQGPTGTGLQGPQGDTGATGPIGQTGAQGEQGPIGPQGVQGSQGAKGDQGDIGPQGDTGSTGLTGDQGVQGPIGPKGDQGDQGPTGAQGTTGATGEIGPQGDQGAQGDTGAQGPTGAQGDQGDQGPKGDTGDQGVQGAQGPTGAKGDQGDIGPTGSIGPQGATGNVGPQGDTGATGSQGPQGDQGATGAQGFTGAQGDQGDTGATGLQGPQGQKGDQGEKGDQGDQGPTGAQGSQGATGAQGPQGQIGAQGATGATGATGSQGPQGTQGVQGPSSTLQYVEEFRNTTTPNATVPVHGVQVFGAETNIDIRLGAKGNGAILAQIPDNTATGGNKRGTNAVDFQKTRSANTQVASGDSAVITGGKNNTAGGTSNAVVAGNNNTTTGTSSVIVGGMFNSIDTNVSGAGILSGKDALATNTGTYQAGGRFTLQGDAQRGEFVLKARTTNNTATELLTWGDGDANTDVTSGTKRLTLKDRQSMMIEANIMGVNEDDQTEIASYKIQAVARRTTAAANTTIDYKNITTLHEATGANWDVNLEADTTNGALKFTSTGETSKNIRWVGNIRTVEILIPEAVAPGFDADAQAFFDATGISDSTQKTAVDNLVVGLKADGLWTKLKAVYPMVGGTATTHKFNLKDPQDTDGAFRLSFNGTWTHSSTGAKSDGTSGWANTHVVPNSNLNLNEGFIGYYSRDNIEGSQDVEIGVNDGANSLFLAIQWTAAEGNFRAFNGNQTAGTANPNSKSGWWMLHRNSSSQIETTRNNTVIYTDTNNTSGRSSNKIYLGAYNSGGTGLYPTPRECAFAVIGHLGLTSGEKAALYTRIQAFQTELGRQV